MNKIAIPWCLSRLVVREPTTSILKFLKCKESLIEINSLWRCRNGVRTNKLDEVYIADVRQRGRKCHCTSFFSFFGNELVQVFVWQHAWHQTTCKSPREVSKNREVVIASCNNHFQHCMYEIAMSAQASLYNYMYRCFILENMLASDTVFSCSSATASTSEQTAELCTVLP